MKKGFKIVVSLILLCAMLCVLAGCEKSLSGTYVSTEGLVEQSLTFDLDGNVKVSAFGIDVNGTYAVKGDKLIITYSLLGLSYDLESTFTRGFGTITVDGTEFTKK